MVNSDSGSLPSPEASQTEAWPFLVSAGRTVPQRVILAPSFLIAKKRTFLLFRATGAAEEHVGLEKSIGITWICNISDEDSGEFATVFRITRATAEMIGQEGPPLLDSSSRPVYFTHGVVVRGSIVSLSEATMEQAGVITLQEFASFWKADDRSASTKSAERIATTGEHSARLSLVLKMLPPISYPALSTSNSNEPEKDPPASSADLPKSFEKNQTTFPVNKPKPGATTSAFPNTLGRVVGPPNQGSVRIKPVKELKFAKNIKIWTFLAALAVLIIIVVVLAAILAITPASSLASPPGW